MPWVPRPVFDLMLRALEAQAFSGIQDAGGQNAPRENEAGSQPAIVGGAPRGMAAPTTPAAPLATAVLNACDYFADGDPGEKAANIALAARLAAEGESDQAIIARIRQGGLIDAVLATG